jgi:hypothetical protein
MTVDESDRAIARSVLALGRDLGLVTVAEGVESREGWDLLTSLGCDMAQGFVVCPPLTSGQFQEWLDRRQPDEFAYLDSGPAAPGPGGQPAPDGGGEGVSIPTDERGEPGERSERGERGEPDELERDEHEDDGGHGNGEDAVPSPEAAPAEVPGS